MKKNKAMRIASILMVAALVSTCAISGTFAKYVTGDSADDAARVAKFGVVALASGTLYSDTYKTVVADDAVNTNAPGVKGDYENIDAEPSTKLSVISSTFHGSSDNWTGTEPARTEVIKGVNGTDNVVAPGTKNDDGLTFTVTGKPEVATDVAFVVKNAEKDKFECTDIYLAKADYGVMVYVSDKKADMDKYVTTHAIYKYVEADKNFVAVPATEEFVNDTKYYVLKDNELLKGMEEDYYPLQYTLKKNNVVFNDGTKDIKDVKAADILQALTGNKFSKKFSANDDLADADNGIGNLNITWKWDFEDPDAADKLAAYNTAKSAYATVSAELSSLIASGASDADVTAKRAEVEAAAVALEAAENAYYLIDREDTTLGNMIAAQKGSTEFVVVKKNGANYDEVQYTTAINKNASDKDFLNTVIVAYTGTTAPTKLGADSICAVLSTAFALDITVTQID